MGSLQQAYQSIYYNEQELREEVAEFCNEFFFDTEEETEYFVEELFKDEDIVLEFFDDVLEFSSEFQLNEDTYITEIRSALIKHGLKIGQGLLRKATPAVRGMSAKTLTKQGIQAGGLTQKGALLGKTNRPALATQTRAIQTARATRQAGVPRTQEPNKFLSMLQQKRASRGLPAAGQTTAGTKRATQQRGWLRHRVAVDQANTVATAFMKSLEASTKAAQSAQRVSAASSKLATAARGTKNIGPAIPMSGAKRSTGSGLIGTRDVLTDIGQVSKKYGLDRPAPRPNWGPGSGMGPKQSGIPRLPQAKQPGPGVGRREVASSGGVSSKGGKMGPDGVKGTQLPGYTPASKQTVDVGATKVSSRRTTRDRMGQVGRELRNNKGTAAVALASAAGVYGLTNAALNSGSKTTVDTTDYETKVRRDPTYYADKDPKVQKGKQPPAPKVPETKTPTPEPKVPETKTPTPAPAPKVPETKTPTPAPKKTPTPAPTGGTPAPTGGTPAPKKTPDPAPTGGTTKGTKKPEPKMPTPKESPEVKKKLSKIQRDLKDIMNMRVASLERQGKKSEAKSLRDRISKKYSGYED